MPFDGILPVSAPAADIPAQDTAVPSAKGVNPNFISQSRSPVAQPMGSAAQLYPGTFRPFIYHHPKEQKKKGVFGIEYPNFEIESALASFYASFRLVGYICDPMYGVFRRGLIKLQQKARENVGKLGVNYTDWPKVFEKDPSYILNGVEAAAFLSLAHHYTKKDRKDLHVNLDLAVAAERGLVSDKVDIKELWQSKNPIIESAMDRHMWQYRLRYGAAPFFLASLPIGILANAFVITAERTAFYRPIAYDVLKKAVTDVQIHNLDSDLVKSKLTDDLIKVLQQQRMDHRLASIPHEQIHAIRPVLSTIAQDIIDKKFGFAGMIYIMGGGVIVPEDPEQTRLNYEHVQKVGVSGIAREGKIIREQLNVGPAKTWEAHISAQRAAAEGLGQPGIPAAPA